MICYSHQNKKACYPAIQTLKGGGTSSLFDLDDTILEQGTTCKFTRMSALGEIKSMIHALKSIGIDFDLFRCPNDLVCRPLVAGELRIVVDGRPCIYTEATKQVTPIVPSTLDLATLPMAIHWVDQGSTGMSGLWFLADKMQMMVLPRFDQFHRVWNDIKNAAKKSMNFPWKCIICMSLVFNLRYGPFGKGSWNSSMQEWHKELLMEVSCDHEFFQEWACKLAKDVGQPPPSTRDDYQLLHDALRDLKCFRLKGPLVKLMRWFSWFEAVQWHKGQLIGIKMVLVYHFSKMGKEPMVPVLLPLHTGNKKEDHKDCALLGVTGSYCSAVGLIHVCLGGGGVHGAMRRQLGSFQMVVPVNGLMMVTLWW
jgi:hypothetical protein